MATKPILDVPNQRSSPPELNAAEGWTLLLSMQGSLKETYARLGGSEEFHRKERASWDDPPTS
jgi:hypothetical protein